MRHLPDKSTLSILRDCLKAVNIMTPHPIGRVKTRDMIKHQFRANKDEQNQDKIDELRYAAIKAMSNILILKIREQADEAQYKPTNIFTGEEIDK